MKKHLTFPNIAIGLLVLFLSSIMYALKVDVKEQIHEHSLLEKQWSKDSAVKAGYDSCLNQRISITIDSTVKVIK